MATPIIISGSARKQSNTQQYIDLVFGNMPRKEIILLNKQIYPYDYAEVYPEDDEFINVTTEIREHNAIIFATPVYWYAMSGRLKTFFDRLTDLTHEHKAIGKQLKGRFVFLLSVSVEDKWPEGFEEPFRLTAEYFDMHYGGGIHFNSQQPLIDQNKDIQQFIHRIKEVT